MNLRRDTRIMLILGAVPLLGLALLWLGYVLWYRACGGRAEEPTSDAVSSPADSGVTFGPTESESPLVGVPDDG